MNEKRKRSNITILFQALIIVKKSLVRKMKGMSRNIYMKHLERLVKNWQSSAGHEVILKKDILSKATKQ